MVKRSVRYAKGLVKTMYGKADMSANVVGKSIKTNFICGDFSVSHPVEQKTWQYEKDNCFAYTSVGDGDNSFSGTRLHNLR